MEKHTTMFSSSENNCTKYWGFLFLFLFYHTLPSVYHKEILNIVWKTEIPRVKRSHTIIEQKTVCMNITI